MDLNDLRACGPVYAVAVGECRGLYSSLAECQNALSGAHHAVYAAFPNALAAIEWLELSVDKEKPIPNATASVYIGWRKNCLVLWQPDQPTATKCFRNVPKHDRGVVGLMRALDHTAQEAAVNIYCSDSSAVKWFNYETSLSPLWQQVYQLARRRQVVVVVKYLPKTNPEINNAFYVADLYWMDRE
jgi:hypothetical protein